jgi:HSP20 family protein
MAEFRSLIPLGRSALSRGAYDPFFNLQEEMNRLFEGFGQRLPAPFESGKQGFIVPKVDVAETDAGLELTAELPGFDEKDVSLDIHDGVLTIKAEHKGEREEKDEKKNYHLVECTTGSFLRRFALPFEADADKASAHIDKGLLKVSVPRAAALEKKPKEIPVSSAK